MLAQGVHGSLRHHETVVVRKPEVVEIGTATICNQRYAGIAAALSPEGAPIVVGGGTLPAVGDERKSGQGNSFNDQVTAVEPVGCGTGGLLVKWGTGTYTPLLCPLSLSRNTTHSTTTEGPPSCGPSSHAGRVRDQLDTSRPTPRRR